MNNVTHLQSEGYDQGVASEKTPVIEWIFFNLKYDEVTDEVVDPIVTFRDLARGIAETGVELSLNNPANFWKDLTRSATRDSNWPATVLAKGYTGRDAIGQAQGASFEFVKIADGQKTPFEHEELRFRPREVLSQRVQSLSIPLAMRALGRRDENWLSQVAVRLNLVESYFALFSSRPVLEVAFLQTGLKLSRGEVDAAFSIVTDEGTWLLSAEAKGRNEPLHLPQIARAARELRRASAVMPEVVGVIPFGMKIVGVSHIWCVEFDPVSDDPNELPGVASEGAFELFPPVTGIN